MNYCIKKISYYLNNLQEDEYFFPTDGVKKCYDGISFHNKEKIDKIIYVSTTIPEYIFWADFAKVHYEIGLDNAGMMKMYQGNTSLFAAISYANSILNVDNSVNNVLVLSGESYCRMSEKYDEISQCQLTDGCCGILVGESKNESVVINYKSKIIQEYGNLFYYPVDGPKSYEKINDITALFLKYKLNDLAEKNFNLEQYIDVIAKYYEKIIKEMLRDSGIELNDVCKIIIPNIGKIYADKICDNLKIALDKTSWIECNEIGHFGTADIFVNYSFLLDQNILEKGKYVILVNHSYEGRISAVLIKV